MAGAKELRHRGGLGVHARLLLRGFFNNDPMASDLTFTMIKPEAVAAGHAGKIIDMLIENGFRVEALKLTRLSRQEAGTFYEVHRERPFYGELVEYMASGPIYAAILRKDNAVEDFRRLIGATDPAQAEEGTIRKRFAESKARNAVHGSDSDANAAIEAAFFFSVRERY
jgi:nucleoside-diphosphate kinase